MLSGAVVLALNRKHLQSRLAIWFAIDAVRSKLTNGGFFLNERDTDPTRLSPDLSHGCTRYPLR